MQVPIACVHRRLKYNTFGRTGVRSFSFFPQWSSNYFFELANFVSVMNVCTPEDYPARKIVEIRLLGIKIFPFGRFIKNKAFQQKE